MQDVVQRIRKLKEKRNAVILAHNYQRAEVQDVSDFSGDSLGLSRRAAETDADIIVFCGVHFMAETAAILCPHKTVLMPDANAGCPMANMITVRELMDYKKKYPDAAVVTYVNSTAAVKAESDVCCTSANAVDIVSRIEPGREILFVPDQYLGAYAAKVSGRKIHLTKGYCPTHHRIRAKDIRGAKDAHPDALVLVHPECTADVIELADYVGSTGGIAEFCAASLAKEFIIATEIGMLHSLRTANPDKEFHPATELADCPDMKLTTLEKIVWCLEERKEVVSVPKDIASRARLAIEKMLEWS